MVGWWDGEQLYLKAFESTIEDKLTLQNIFFNFLYKKRWFERTPREATMGAASWSAPIGCSKHQGAMFHLVGVTADSVISCHQVPRLEINQGGLGSKQTGRDPCVWSWCCENTTGLIKQGARYLIIRILHPRLLAGIDWGWGNFKIT